jgi:formyltetrahydrofolate hydrolase
LKIILRTGDESPYNRMVLIISHFAKQGIDLRRPYLNYDSFDIYRRIKLCHRDEVADLIRKGKDLERIVLARAVRSHLQNRVLVYGDRTVVFE